jgi:N-acetylmuramoyl-L-alanine amidase
MPKATKVEYIVEHCTAGYGSVASVQRYWKKQLGWRNPGYHVIIDLEGKKHYLLPFDQTSNGVRGYNSKSLHVSYIGGVDPLNYKKALDSRTEEQKCAMLEVEIEMIQWLVANGKKDCHNNLMILGHRDFSPDKNLDGMINSNERIKECPSYDAIPEKYWIGATNQKQLLPYNRKKH